MAFARILKSWSRFWGRTASHMPAYPEAVPVAAQTPHTADGPGVASAAPLASPGALAPDVAPQAVGSAMPHGATPCGGRACHPAPALGHLAHNPVHGTTAGAPPEPPLACGGTRSTPRRDLRAAGTHRSVAGTAEPTLALVPGGARTRARAARPLTVRYAQGPRCESRLVISGRLADVCAELDRLALLEQRGELQLRAA